jgi:hypothetical protein
MLLSNNRIISFIWSQTDSKVFVEYINNNFETVSGVSHEIYLDALKIVNLLPEFDMANYLRKVAQRSAAKASDGQADLQQNFLSQHQCSELIPMPV